MENLKTDPNHPVNVITEETTIGQMGLTKREEFTKAAMQGIWSGLTDPHYDDYDRIAEMAVKQADALINELNQTKS